MRAIPRILLILHALALTPDASLISANALAPPPMPTATSTPIPTAIVAAGAASTITPAAQLSAGAAGNGVAPPNPCDDTAGGPEITGVAERFRQTTYWGCVTRGTYRHCGWHMPIIDAGAARGAWSAGGGMRAAGAAGVVALLVWMG